MREVKCKECGESFTEDDSNPSIHYSNPSEICPNCERFKRVKKGDYYQNADGSYIKK